MGKLDKRKALKHDKGHKRPAAVKCKYCEEWYTPFGPADKYHNKKKCISPEQNSKRR